MARTFLEFNAGEFFTNINKRFEKNVRENIIPLIVETIQSGRSPVKSKSFEQYSPSYRKQIRDGRYRQYGKRTRPVNLTLSGKMLRAFKVRGLVKGGVTIFNSNKLAKYHNNPDSNSRVPERKFLPDENGQVFKPFIQDAINNELEKAIAKEIRK